VKGRFPTNTFDPMLLSPFLETNCLVLH